MPRAYCPQCGAEVPVDDEGRCHVGHDVDLTAATGNQDLASAARALEAEFEDSHPDEPEPWVAEIEDEPGGARQPPVGDAGPPGVDRDVDEELPPAAHPQSRSPMESDTWQPRTAEPAGPGPQPPPEPVPPDDLEDDFGLDDLEAAVAELEVEERGAVEQAGQPAPPTGQPLEPGEQATAAEREVPPPPPAPEAGPAAVPAEQPDQGPTPEPQRPESPPERRPEPPAEPGPETHDEAEDEAEDEGSEAEEDQADEPARELDLSNFTASGERVGEGGKKRGLFGFGR